MKKESTTRVSGIGVHIVMPKIDVPPRQAPKRHVDERDDDESPTAKQAAPPPGTGKFVDKSL